MHIQMLSELKQGLPTKSNLQFTASISQMR